MRSAAHKTRCLNCDYLQSSTNSLSFVLTCCLSISLFLLPAFWLSRPSIQAAWEKPSSDQWTESSLKRGLNVGSRMLSFFWNSNVQAYCLMLWYKKSIDNCVYDTKLKPSNAFNKQDANVRFSHYACSNCSFRWEVRQPQVMKSCRMNLMYFLSYRQGCSSPVSPVEICMVLLLIGWKLVMILVADSW